MSDRFGSQQGLILRVNGSPAYQGAISATTSVATLALTKGGMYLLHASGPVKFHGAIASNGTVELASGTQEVLTAAKGVDLQTDEKFVFTATGKETHLAAICASGTATLTVHRLK